MKDANLKLKNKIMMQVYTIYFLRKIGEPLFVKVGLFVALLVAIIFTVSLPSILANLASVFKNNGNTLVFFGTAFSGSLLVVKLIVVTQLFICVALTRDLFKLLPRLHLKGITQ